MTSADVAYWRPLFALSREGPRAIRCVAVALLTGALAGAAQGQRAPATASRSARDVLLDRMLRAEDLRGRGAEGVSPLVAGLTSADATVRRTAVRGLGRLEDPSHLAAVAGRLTDSVASVRAEAANAVAQVVRQAMRSDSSAGAAIVDSAFVLLRSAARDERSSEVLGVLARSIGRLPYRSAAQARSAEEEIAGIAGRAATGTGSVTGGPRAPAPVMHGVAHALFTIARARRTLGNLTGPSLALLRTAAGFSRDSNTVPAPSAQSIVEVRRLGWLALVAAGNADALLARAGARDADAQVRRLAVLSLAAITDAYLQRDLLRRARDDTAFIVRLEAVRMYRQLFGAESCRPLMEAASDSNAHVRLVAIDALGGACPEKAEVRTLLLGLAQAGAPLPRGRAQETAWHARAHALVALARVDTAAVRAPLARAAGQSIWQLRMYAARAAATIRDTTLLRRLARDSIGNVREAAIQGLVTVAAHAADDDYIAGLSSPDAQVVLAAAAALEGSPRGTRLSRPLLDALSRITRERRETSRDPRMEIVARLGEMMDSTVAARLAPYVRDFDPAVASRAAAVVSAWSGREVRAVPDRLPANAVPEGAAVASQIVLRFTMSPRNGGGSFLLRLDPQLAPASVARITALARRGYYNGLTWHRVAANFVVQGGSPKMSEYVGDGPFMRDEVGLVSHRRGTVGISTRGRDTGDAQLFINLVDNFRLDHDYTVVAVVERGMDVVDGILEGDIIERVDVVSG